MQRDEGSTTMRKSARQEQITEVVKALHRPGLPLAKGRWAISGVVIGVLGSSWVGVQHRQAAPPDSSVGTTAEAEGTIDGAVRRVSQGVQDVSTGVQERYASVRNSMHNQDLIAEVKARLKQESSLDAEQIDVDATGEGTVVLTGQVPDAASKERAVDLTREIRGIRRVEDHLAIPPTRRVFESKEPDAETSGVAVRPRRFR
jgi:osmotically-inducible protein OsmY